MDAELENDLLVGARALPYRHGHLGRLEVEEVGGEPVIGKIRRRTFGIKAHRLGQRVFLHHALGLVEEFIGHVSQFGHALFGKLSALHGREPRQPVDRMFRLRNALVAVVGKWAIKRVMALRADGDFGLLGQSHDLLGVGDPPFDLFGPRKSFLGEIFLLEQTPIILIARIDPGGVDVRQRDGFQRHPCGLGDECLHGDVLPVIILNAGGRFHLDHLPDRLAVLPDRQQHIGKSHGTLHPERSLKNRLAGICHQLSGARVCAVEALGLEINERSLPLGIVDASGDVTDLVAHLKSRLGLG